jgi:hypothetical protein
MTRSYCLFGKACYSAATLVVATMMSAGFAHADGEYWAMDVSENTRGGVLSVTKGKVTFVSTVTDYGDGVSAGVSLTQRLPFEHGIEGLTLAIGPAIGFGGGDLSEVEFGVAGSAQRYVPTAWGSYFWQASVGSTNRSFFLQAQATLSEPKITVALSRGGSTLYDETTLSISRQWGESNVSLRTGYRFQAEDLFLGFSVNTF